MKLELINVEFYVNNTNATDHNEYVVKDGHYHAIDSLESNEIDILFLKFSNHPDIRHYCSALFKEIPDRRIVVKKVIHRFFGELCCKKMDIDGAGTLNVENVCQDKKQNMFYRNSMDLADIDEGALWELRGDLLVLVDDDQYRSLKFGEWGEFFTKK